MAKDGTDGKAPIKDGHAAAGEKNPFFTTMVVDGSFPIDVGLDAFLKTEGHFVLKAESPQEALDMARRFQPDLILMDSQLPGITGKNLMPDLLAVHATAAIIVLAVNLTVAEAVEAIKSGAVDVLERPLDLKRLKVAIDTQKALFQPVGLKAQA